MWEIEFFEKENGHCPVEEFLDGLSPKKDLPYIDNAMNQLEELGYKLRRPQAAPLQDGIYELRVKTINGKFRFLYFFYDRNKIIITHGIKKKTGSVPQPELDHALEYRSIYYSNGKGKSR
jgi:phage-related protein